VLSKNRISDVPFGPGSPLSALTEEARKARYTQKKCISIVFAYKFI